MCVRTEAPGDAMSLDRRILVKVDRRLFSEMDHSVGTQLVKLPVSGAV